MKLVLVTLCLGIFSQAIIVSPIAPKPKDWKSLFNGKNLDGWETYLDRPNQSDKTVAPIGLNTDPNHVFSVVTEDGKPAIRISGETFGGINTKDDFENYQLRLEFKWGKQKWPPKLNQPRDSGLLYHSVGAHGTSMLWKESFEYQIQEGDSGDYWGVMNVLADIPARQNEKGNYVYQSGTTSITFKDKTPVGRSCLKSLDNELPTGQWNTLDLYCHSDTCLHVLNGKVNMMLTHTRHIVNGQEKPLTKGQIQIQSEGAEVFYRAIQVRKIDQFPTELLRQ